MAVLIGLGTTNGDENAGGFGDDVGDVECGQFARSQGRGVAEQDDGSVADTNRCFQVDARHDSIDLIDSQWMRLAARRGAHDPAKSTTNTAHQNVRGGIWQARFAVLMRDPRAVAIEGAETPSNLVPFAQFVAFALTRS